MSIKVENNLRIKCDNIKMLQNLIDFIIKRSYNNVEYLTMEFAQNNNESFRYFEDELDSYYLDFRSNKHTTDYKYSLDEGTFELIYCTRNQPNKTWLVELTNHINYISNQMDEEINFSLTHYYYCHSQNFAGIMEWSNGEDVHYYIYDSYYKFLKDNKPKEFVEIMKYEKIMKIGEVTTPITG